MKPAIPLVAVDRATAELRRAGPIALTLAGQRVALMLAAEDLTPKALAALASLAGSAPVLAMSARRAEALGIGDGGEPALLRPISARDSAQDAAIFIALADPLREQVNLKDWQSIPTQPWVNAAIALTKLAGLLPIAVLAETVEAQTLGAETADPMPSVSAEEILAYPRDAARSLKRVAEADLPVAASEQCHVIAFRPADGGSEHLALIVGRPDLGRPVLARLHSACFTGDLLGSLRCDCGEQLQGAIARLAQEGGGVLLYLAQEGRGIGLVNKLRAYKLQDDGLDTLEANRRLGFEDDERLYLPAVQMLDDLGIKAVRLLTNNPSKVDALLRHGISVVERVPHVFPANPHNRRYLATKAARSGHLF